MTQAEPLPRVKVGVLLTAEPGDLAEWLRDAAAFDAAGADALWLDLESQPELDPLVVAAALSVVTFRCQLFVSLPEPDQGWPQASRPLATIDRLSRGRVRFVAGAEAALAGSTAGVAFMRQIAGGPAVLDETEGQQWTVEPPPDGRASWQAILLAARERGAYGLMVPAGPRLLDLLRNPDDQDDRRDLQLSVG